MKDPDCIFCKIVAGAIPCAKVLDDEFALAFLDIGPLAEGHLLLIPKEHFVTVDQMPADVAAGVFRHVPALGRAVQAAVGCQGYNVLQNNGRAAHQVVPHVHVHVIPRKPGDAFQFNWPAGAYAPGEIEKLAGSIRRRLSPG